MIRNGDLLIRFKEQELILTPEKAIFWVDKNILVLSDIHLGKSGHFRKAGIAIPSTVNENNLHRLDALIKYYSPTRILYLGDLFHSDINSEWIAFKTWRSQYPEIVMNLSIGNHDFHSVDEYESIGLFCSHSIEIDPFLLLHDSTDYKIENKFFTISGHVHPSIKLLGKGRQSVRVPCFYFGEDGALLPAFGSFTGTHTIKPKVDDLVFGIINEQIIKIT